MTIKTTLLSAGSSGPAEFLSSHKTVQQVIVETYLAYRRMFSMGMFTHREYFAVIRCIKR